MDRNILLKSSRAKFVSTFGEMIDGVVHQSIETLFEKADKSLNSQEQRQLLDARSFMTRHEQSLVSHISNNLEKLLDRSFQTAYDTFRPSFSNSAKSNLMLMDICAFEDDLRLEIITSNFRSEAGGQLRDLNIRIAILFEREDIAERENPFRPYLLTRALVLGVEAAQAEPSLATVITDQLAEELLRKVVKLYEGVNNHLSESGVAAQLQFRPQRPYSTDAANKEKDEDKGLVKLMQDCKALMPNSSEVENINDDIATPNQFTRIEQLLSSIKLNKKKKTKTKSNDPDFPEINSNLLDSVGSLFEQGGTVSEWLGGVQEVGDTLRRMFFNGTRRVPDDKNKDAQDEIVSPADQPNTVAISPQLSSALQSPVPSINEMIGINGEVRNLLIETRDKLNSLASDHDEKMIIDVVAMLFEFILNDHQVPAEVRAQLGRLQFSVLKMALMDSALLTKKSHPARLLVNRIGSISVGLQQIDPSGERISAEICRIVEELLANDAENPELFSKMLDQLDGFIARELIASNADVENAINVVVKAENSTKRVEQISKKLEELIDGMADMPIEPYLRQFIIDTWSQVIERAQNSPDTDAIRFRQLVPDLLWSVLPKTDHVDRAALLKLLPVFVSILREGVSLAGWELKQQQELLNWLADLHTRAMRGEENQQTGEEESAPSLLDVQNLFHHFVYDDDISASDSISLKDTEVRFSSAGLRGDGDEEADDERYGAGAREKPLTADSTLSFLDERLENELESDELSEDETVHDVEDKEEDILDRLRSGVMVEINLSGIPTLGRLNWISPNSSKLILTMQGEVEPSVISVRMFRRMLKNSRARFVEVAPLFERAVQSLLESADLIDLTHST